MATLHALVEKLGSEFDEDTMFVAAHDISVDRLPSNDKKRKDWQPTIKCRVFLTSITMAAALPAISTGMNVMERITENADTTYNLFTVEQFKCQALFICDGAGNAKAAGYLVTCHEESGDYYIASMGYRSCVEYFASLPKDSLPGKTKLPYCLPSPIPNSTKEHPLRHDASSGLFHQPWDGEFTVAAPSRRYKHKSSDKARKQLSSNATFVLEPTQLDEGDVASTFRCDVNGFNKVSMSDGDKSITNGVQAANPCMTETHCDCWAHLSRTNSDVIHGKKHPEKIPKFEWDNLAPGERPAYYSARKKMLYRYVMRRLREARHCRHRPLALKIIDDLHRCLLENRVYYTKDDEYDLRYPALDLDRFSLEVAAEADEGIHIPGDFRKYTTDHLIPAFGRPTTNGSHGLWLMSDVCDADATALDENLKAVQRSRNNPNRLIPGVPLHANSGEANHLAMKKALEEKGGGGSRRGTVVKNLDSLREVGREYSRNERQHYGVSIVPPPFGQGSYGRIKSDRYADARRLGMLFCGQNGNINEPVCQIDLLDCKSRKTGKGMQTVLYLVNGEEQLNELEEAVRGQGVDMEDRDAVIRAKRDLLEHWFKQYKRVSNATSNELDAMLSDTADDYYREKMGLSSGESDDESAQVPLPDESERDNDIWSDCKSLAVSDIYGWEQTFVAVSPIDIDVEGAKALEPFRVSLNGNEAEIVYRWRCNCHNALDDGLCEHIIFVQHTSWDPLSTDVDLTGYTGIEVPLSMVDCVSFLSSN